MSVIRRLLGRSKEKGPTRSTISEYGFKVLEDPVDANIDIIAIHGLDGDRTLSWSTKDGTCWLKDFLPKHLPTARILTYGYDSATVGDRQLSHQSMGDHARDLLVKLSLLRDSDSTDGRPIVFIAHSLGGIILKFALLKASMAHEGHNEHHRSIFTSTKGIIFLGTPHQGAPGTDFLMLLLHIQSVYKYTNTRILQHLQRDGELLQDQLQDYASISANFNTKFIYETRATKLIGGTSAVLVPKATAVVHGTLNVEAVGCNRDHIQLSKFESAEDDDFLTIVGLLRQIVRAALASPARATSS